MGKLEQPAHSRHPKKKCGGCGKEFTRVEMSNHMLEIARSLRV